MTRQKNAVSKFIHIRNKKIEEMGRKINKVVYSETVRKFIRTRNRRIAEIGRGLNKFEK